jgi:hypothetical protein
VLKIERFSANWALKMTSETFYFISINNLNWNYYF